jgi:hypothetical protein
MSQEKRNGSLSSGHDPFGSSSEVVFQVPRLQLSSSSFLRQSHRPLHRRSALSPLLHASLHPQVLWNGLLRFQAEHSFIGLLHIGWSSVRCSRLFLVVLNDDTTPSKSRLFGERRRIQLCDK